MLVQSHVYHLSNWLGRTQKSAMLYLLHVRTGTYTQ